MASTVYETGTIRVTPACVVRGWLYVSFLFLLGAAFLLIDLRHDPVAALGIGGLTLGFAVASFLALWSFRRKTARRRRIRESSDLQGDSWNVDESDWPFGS